MHELTTRQHEVLTFICESLVHDGFAPSIRDICRHFGFASTNAAFDHLRFLIKKGAIRVLGGRLRGPIYLPSDKGWTLFGVPVGHCPHCRQPKPSKAVA